MTFIEKKYFDKFEKIIETLAFQNSWVYSDIMSSADAVEELKQDLITHYFVVAENFPGDYKDFDSYMYVSLRNFLVDKKNEYYQRQESLKEIVSLETGVETPEESDEIFLKDIVQAIKREWVEEGYRDVDEMLADIDIQRILETLSYPARLALQYIIEKKDFLDISAMDFWTFIENLGTTRYKVMKELKTSPLLLDFIERS